MIRKQLKLEIQQVLCSFPESILEDVLKFLKELQNERADKVRLTNNLRQIVSNHKELLEKLSQ